MTRGDELREYRTTDFIPYGRENSAGPLEREFYHKGQFYELEETDCGFVIARDHGVFALTDSVESFERHLKSIEHVLRDYSAIELI